MPKNCSSSCEPKISTCCKKATLAATTLREGGSGDRRGQVPVVSDSHRLSHTLSILVNKETRRRSVNEGGLGDGARDRDKRIRKAFYWWFVKGGGPGNPDWSAPCSIKGLTSRVPPGCSCRRCAPPLAVGARPSDRARARAAPCGCCTCLLRCAHS